MLKAYHQHLETMFKICSRYFIEVTTYGMILSNSATHNIILITTLTRCLYTVLLGIALWNQQAGVTYTVLFSNAVSIYCLLDVWICSWNWLSICKHGKHLLLLSCDEKSISGMLCIDTNKRSKRKNVAFNIIYNNWLIEYGFCVNAMLKIDLIFNIMCI